MNGPGYVASVEPDSYEAHCQAHPEMWSGHRTPRFEAAQADANAHNNDHHSPLPHSQLDFDAEQASRGSAKDDTSGVEA